MAQISAAGKALAILGSFSRTRTVLTLSQIARLTDLPLSTTHRVVAELSSWGALERDEEGRWHIGLRLWEVGAICPRGQILREVALPFMQDLYEGTHENIQLAVREGTELVFVERIAGHRSVELQTMVGTRFPLDSTGVGLVLLAFAPPEIRDAVLASPRPKHTPLTTTDEGELRGVLAQIRQAGYSVSDRQLSRDTVGVAAPVRIGPNGPINAALGVVVLAGEKDPVTPNTAAIVRRLRRPLIDAAAQVSVELGRRAGDLG